jgi:hypothetical protein
MSLAPFLSTRRLSGTGTMPAGRRATSPEPSQFVRRKALLARCDRRYNRAMDDFLIVPELVIKDTPKPRRLTKLSEARAYVEEAMREGRPAPWREVWHRLKTVTAEEDAIEAIGDLRELLEEEDLLLPSRD